MGMIEVHSHPLSTRFRAGVCSLSAVFWLASVITVVIVPLYIAWVSHAFWIEQKVVWEQPNVEFRHEALVLVEGMSGGAPFQRVWTTSPAANDLLGSTAVRAPVLRVSSTDSNRDTRPDTLTISSEMPLLDTEAVHRSVVVAAVRFTFEERTRVQADGLLIVDASSPMPGSGVVTQGDLVLRQYAPVKSSAVFTDLGFGMDALLPLSTTDVTDLSLASIMDRLASRNLTTVFSPGTHHTWVSAIAPSVSSALGGPAKTFNASMTVRINQVPLLVRPYVSEELKHGWIQYLAFFVVVWWLIKWIRQLVFGTALLYSSVSSDAAPSKKLHLH